MRRRHLAIATFVALGALAAAACQPVAPAPPPPAPAPPPPPQVNACDVPVGPDGKTEYFAVVDEGEGSTRAVPFDAGSPQEQQADVAAIEATQGDVLAVEVDWPVRAAVNPDPADDPRFPDQWGVTAAGFPTAWDVAHAASQGSKAGTPVRVAVLDTGVHRLHEDLGSTAVLSPGIDEIGGGTPTSDPNGHGTHVAGILGARDNTVGGVGGAPDVEILPVRVLDASGSGSYSSVINGIRDAAAAGAKVISMSLGGSGYSGDLQAAVNYAVGDPFRAVVIAAAGNDGTCSASYPAALNGVISVAATTYPGTSLAAYSQRGPGVDIAAPGSTVLSTLNTGGYGDKSGTSMATPFVAAAAALLIAKCPGISSAAIETRLESNTTALAGIQPGSGALRADLATAGGC